MKINGKTILSTSSTTTNYVLKQSSTVGTLINSQIFDNGTNVGIGTTSPSAKTAIHKSESGSNPSAVLRLENTGANYTSKLILTDGTTNDANISYIGSNQSLGFGVGSSLNQMIINSSGNVGIGTSSPTAKLHISDTNKVFDGYGNVNIFTSDTATTNIGGSIALGGTNATGGTNPYVFAKIQGIKESSAGNYNGALIFGTTSPSSAVTEKMRITSVGNVGIGTTSPSEKLEVQSGAAGAKIKVSNSGGGSASLEISSNASSVAQLNFTNQLSLIGGNVGIGTSSPDSSSLLDLSSITQGFLAPRMRTSERDSIGSPANGLIIFNTDSETIDVFTNGGGWKSVLFL